MLKLAMVLIVFVTLFVNACHLKTIDSNKQESASDFFDGAIAQTPIDAKKHGKRLSMLLGCTGCHQNDFSGGPFNQGWVAPNVSLMIDKYDYSSLERAIRQGIGLDGRFLRLMPSEMYQSLSNADLRSLVDYLLTIKPTGKPQTRFEPGTNLLQQWDRDGYTNANALGLFWSTQPGPIALGPKHTRGRYLAINLCAECHNNAFQGYKDFTPDLAIIAAYSDEEFARLLTQGKGKFREDLGLMSLVSPARFPHLTNQEYNDLSAYLRARATALSTQE